MSCDSSLKDINVTIEFGKSLGILFSKVCGNPVCLAKSRTHPCQSLLGVSYSRWSGLGHQLTTLKVPNSGVACTGWPTRRWPMRWPALGRTPQALSGPLTNAGGRGRGCHKCLKKFVIHTKKLLENSLNFVLENVWEPCMI